MNTLLCYNCQEEIYFDDNVKSSSGKKIPLDVHTGEPHHCPSSPYHKETKTGKTMTERLTDLEERVSRLEDSMK